MEAIKYERPFHSRLSFNVICRFLGDYSLGRDVPDSSGPEKCLCLFVWHLLWWVIYLFAPPAPGRKMHSAGRAWRRGHPIHCPVVAPAGFLGLKVSRSPPQGSRTPMARFSTSVDQLGCGCAQTTPAQHGVTATGQRSPSLHGTRRCGCFLGARLPQLCNRTEVLAEVKKYIPRKSSLWFINTNTPE